MRFIVVCMFLTGLFAVKSYAAVPVRQSGSPSGSEEAFSQTAERIKTAPEVSVPVPVSGERTEGGVFAEEKLLADSSARILRSVLERMPSVRENIAPLEKRRARAFTCNINFVAGCVFYGDGFSLKAEHRFVSGSVMSYSAGGAFEAALYGDSKGALYLGCELRYQYLAGHTKYNDIRHSDQLRCGYFCVMPYLQLRAWRVYLNLGVDNWLLQSFSLKKQDELLGATRSCMNRHRMLPRAEVGVNLNRFRLGVFYTFGMKNRGLFDLDELASYTRIHYKEEASGSQVGMTMSLKLWRNGY